MNYLAATMDGESTVCDPAHVADCPGPAGGDHIPRRVRFVGTAAIDVERGSVLRVGYTWAPESRHPMFHADWIVVRFDSGPTIVLTPAEYEEIPA